MGVGCEPKIEVTVKMKKKVGGGVSGVWVLSGGIRVDVKQGLKLL